MSDETQERPMTGQRVQVFNPGPLSTGVVVDDQRHPRRSDCVRVKWDDDGSETWSYVRFLRPIGKGADPS